MLPLHGKPQTKSYRLIQNTVYNVYYYVYKNLSLTPNNYFELCQNLHRLGFLLTASLPASKEKESLVRIHR